jgi:hypothetical protein
MIPLMAISYEIHLRIARSPFKELRSRAHFKRVFGSWVIESGELSSILEKHPILEHAREHSERLRIRPARSLT